VNQGFGIGAFDADATFLAVGPERQRKPQIPHDRFVYRQRCPIERMIVQTQRLSPLRHALRATRNQLPHPVRFSPLQS
jgi:hypothetical protein